MQMFLFVFKWIWCHKLELTFHRKKDMNERKTGKWPILEKSFDFWELLKSTPFDQSYKHPVFAILSGGVFFSRVFRFNLLEFVKYVLWILLIVNSIEFYAPIIWNKLKIHQFEFLSSPFCPSSCWSGLFFLFQFCRIFGLVLHCAAIRRSRNVDIEIQLWQKLNHINKSIRRTLDIAIQYINFDDSNGKITLNHFGWQLKTNQMQTIFQM